jgi:LysR family glycine cleavage system transcriptional activator
VRPHSRIPHLSLLRAFEATVRHASVARAAAELNLTAGAVSRAIRELETELGFALFRRGNRIIAPTAAAEALAEQVREGLQRISLGLARARSVSAVSDSLVLSCEPTFLMRWLIPRLAELQAVVGEARELRLVSAGGVVPFSREGIDLAIRRADFAIGDNVLVETFLEERVGPVCRPEQAAQIRPSGPIEAVLLHTATRPDAWEVWSRATGISVVAVRDLRFEHFYLSLQAAMAGAGLAIGPVALVADDLVAGTLVAPRGFVTDGTSYILMAPRDGVDTAMYQTVLNWLRERAGVLPSASMTGAP